MSRRKQVNVCSVCHRVDEEVTSTGNPLCIICFETCCRETERHGFCNGTQCTAAVEQCRQRRGIAAAPAAETVPPAKQRSVPAPPTAPPPGRVEKSKRETEAASSASVPPDVERPPKAAKALPLTAQPQVEAAPTTPTGALSAREKVLSDIIVTARAKIMKARKTIVKARAGLLEIDDTLQSIDRLLDKAPC